MEELKARDLMSTEVIAISPQATVVEAANKMLDHRVSGLPVVDDLGAGLIAAIVNATIGAIVLLLVIRVFRGGGRWLATGPAAGTVVGGSRWEP